MTGLVVFKMPKLIEARLYINGSFVAKYTDANMPQKCDLKVKAAEIANLTKVDVKLEYDYARDRNITKQEAFTFHPDGNIEIPTKQEIQRITGVDETENQSDLF